MRFNSILSIALAIVFGACDARADESSVVATGKGATALVEVQRNGARGSGSAFCIDAGGYFVTNSHVVGKVPNQDVKLILNPGETDQQVTSAHVIRLDTVNDLALLKADNVKSIVPLELGSSEHVMETQPVMAFGYPFGESLATASGDFPSISVSTGHVTSLRKRAGKLYLIQLDASLNPGNSGGPVLDDKGKVIGVVQAGIPGASLNFAIPVSHLTSFVEKPEIMLTTDLNQSALDKAQDFKIRVSTFDGNTAKMDVDLGLIAWDGSNSANPEAPRHFTAQKTAAGIYTVSAIPVPSTTDEQTLLLTARFSTGLISCRTKELEVTVGDRKLKLSEIRRIDQGHAPSVTLASDDHVEGAVTGLSAVSSEFGELTSVLDLSKALSVDIGPSERTPVGLRYTVSVKRDARSIGEAQGTLTFAGSGARGNAVAAGNASMPPNFIPPAVDSNGSASGDRISVRLPGPVAAVVPAGSGRLLLLCIPTLHQIAVFDIAAERVVHFIPVPSDDMRVAAGADKLLIALVDHSLLQRWDLKTFQRDLTVSLPAGDTVDDLALGSASAGPALLMRRSGPEFIDLATLNPAKVTLGENSNWWHPHPQYPLAVRASADGQTFAAWEPGLSPSGIRLLVLTGNRTTTHYVHDTAGVLLPSSDGSLLFTGRGLMSSDLQILSGFNNNFNNAMLCMPTPQAAYYIGVRMGNPMTPQDKTPPTVSLFSSSDRNTLVQLAEVPELMDRQGVLNINPRRLTIDQRVFYTPELNALVTIPTTADEVYIRHIDLTKTLAKAGIDYLFVTSVPQRAAPSGKHYSYAINVKSNRGDVKYKLESGPDGMKLLPNGTLEWDVPASFSDGQAPIIISIKDASGREIYHNFTITVGAAKS